jgi:hypothetical protein
MFSSVRVQLGLMLDVDFEPVLECVGSTWIEV